MTVSEIPKDKQIVLFDGVCNLCDRVVQIIIRRDSNDVFRFLPLQSELGAEVMSHIGVDIGRTDSIVLYRPGAGYFLKSDAALEIAKSIGFPVLPAVMGVFPKKIRDKIYDYVARNRFKWYGRKDQCMIPTPEIKARFLA